ncbi:MAG: hypothetical protein WC947_09490 [Elusimicrobiota bacterium]
MKSKKPINCEELKSPEKNDYENGDEIVIPEIERGKLTYIYSDKSHPYIINNCNVSQDIFALNLAAGNPEENCDIEGLMSSEIIAFNLFDFLFYIGYADLNAERKKLDFILEKHCSTSWKHLFIVFDCPDDNMLFRDKRKHLSKSSILELLMPDIELSSRELNIAQNAADIVVSDEEKKVLAPVLEHCGTSYHTVKNITTFNGRFLVSETYPFSPIQYFKNNGQITSFIISSNEKIKIFLPACQSSFFITNPAAFDSLLNLGKIYAKKLLTSENLDESVHFLNDRHRKMVIESDKIKDAPKCLWIDGDGYPVFKGKRIKKLNKLHGAIIDFLLKHEGDAIPKDIITRKSYPKKISSKIAIRPMHTPKKEGKYGTVTKGYPQGTKRGSAAYYWFSVNINKIDKVFYELDRTKKLIELIITNAPRGKRTEGTITLLVKD